MTDAPARYEEELCIAADCSELDRVRSWVAAVAAPFGLDRRGRFRAITAVHEALAAQLGPGRHKRSSASVRALWAGGRLTFWIRSPFKLEPGLGTQIMRHCARDVEVVRTKGGSIVRLGI
ncbi:MAG TPA: hypothetical protein VE570_07350 [Thermoleophilaceae bacterium]|jgi:hypothetical protein|nr:hypothetical protein [Thermoleophilaceae bacterium]